MKISLRKENPQHKKLHRRLLPLYMKPTILIAFIVISLVSQTAWATTAMLKHPELQRNLTVGFGLGIMIGYIQGRWISRMWARDYLRVLKREIIFWQAKGATGTTVYVILALGIPIFLGLFMDQSYRILVGIQSYIFGFIGGMNLGLYLWVRRLPR